jgi:hypothetical protein
MHFWTLEDVKSLPNPGVCCPAKLAPLWQTIARMHHVRVAVWNASVGNGWKRHSVSGVIDADMAAVLQQKADTHLASILYLSLSLTSGRHRRYACMHASV